jgi:hypothetical protein
MEEANVRKLMTATFWAYERQQLDRIKQEGRSFVHYTTTEAALSIINNREIWLRNSAVMNDYSEVAHGEACLRYCLYESNDVAPRCKKVFDELQEGLHEKAVRWFVDSAPMRRAFTYLTSISEHGPPQIAAGVVDEESMFGRLSMWRAYGSYGGVGLIFGNEPFMEPKEVLNVYSMPVYYGNPDWFAFEFSKMLNFMEANMAQLKQIDPGVLWENLWRFIHFTSLSCKHPGFKEEREWRITYSADPANEHIDDAKFNASSKIKREFRTVNGLPQRIYKIPFVDYPEEGVVGITLPAFLKQLVIGPTQFPLIVLDALHVAMRRAGFEQDKIRISASQIPLRT